MKYRATTPDGRVYLLSSAAGVRDAKRMGCAVKPMTNYDEQVAAVRKVIGKRRGGR